MPLFQVMRWYGTLGIILIIFSEVNFFLKIQPFANWYFPVIWIGYILTIDAIVYKLKQSSLITTHPSRILGMTIISMLFWWLFEFINIATQNWSYIGVHELGKYKHLFGSISFATVLPAFFETTELIRAVHIFDGWRLRKAHPISRRTIHFLIGCGVVGFFTPFLFPAFAYPLVWLSFFLILDPLNYLHGQPSVIGHLKDKKLTVPLSLLLAGIIMGFMWEFWNYWAIPKWTYDLPFLGFWKIFEMPILGYLGYFPFAFELYAMYWYVRSLFLQRETALI